MNLLRVWILRKSLGIKLIDQQSGASVFDPAGIN